MAGIKAEISSNIEPQLAALIRGIQNPAPLHAQIVEYLHRTTRDRFRSETNPDGSAWAPLSPKYLERKRKNQDKILTYRGYLSSTLRGQYDNKGLEFGSNVIYAATQHFGRRGIPARKILGTNAQQDAHILNLGQSYLRRTQS